MENIDSYQELNLEKEILIFCTSIQSEEDVERFSGEITSLPGILDWNVDYEDWEKVLRIECVGVTSVQIMDLLYNKGVYTREMVN